MDSGPRYSIGELADMAGVTRRTVRYYVQEELLQAPFGVGRGNHYGADHLNRLLRVKTMQEAGRTLDEIRVSLAGGKTTLAELPVTIAPPRTWRRLSLISGVELHVASDVRLPGPAKLQELIAWCRSNFPATRDTDEDTHA